VPHHPASVQPRPPGETSGIVAWRPGIPLPTALHGPGSILFSPQCRPRGRSVNRAHLAAWARRGRL